MVCSGDIREILCTISGKMRYYSDIKLWEYSYLLLMIINFLMASLAIIIISFA